MKPLIQITSALLVGVMLPTLVQAEENRERTHKQAEANKSMQRISRASKIMGTAVKNPNGDTLGDIKELVLNPDNGQVVYAVVSFGGVMGLGNKLFAIPWQALHWIPGEDHYDLNMDKATLMTAPGFDESHWPDSSDSWDLQRQGLHQFYGVTH